MMFPDNDTPGILSMLNSQSLVDKFVDESEKNTIPLEDIVCHMISIEEQSMEEQSMEVEPASCKDDEGTLNWPPALPKVCNLLYTTLLPLSLSSLPLSLLGMDSNYTAGPNTSDSIE